MPLQPDQMLVVIRKDDCHKLKVLAAQQQRPMYRLLGDLIAHAVRVQQVGPAPEDLPMPDALYIFLTPEDALARWQTDETQTILANEHGQYAVVPTGEASAMLAARDRLMVRWWQTSPEELEALDATTNRMRG